MKSVSLLTCTLVALLSNCVEVASGRRGFESCRSLGSGFLSAISLCFFLHVFKLHLSINMLIVHTMNIKKMAVLFPNLRYSLEALILLQKKNCVIRSLNLIEDYKLISLIQILSFFSPRTLSQWLSSFCKGHSGFPSKSSTIGLKNLSLPDQSIRCKSKTDRKFVARVFQRWR